MKDSLDNECGAGEELYTFAVSYPGGQIEEIDIFARDMFNARLKAEICAGRDLKPGWSEIASIAAGGSAGLVRY
jgi:hypothetical protein